MAGEHISLNMVQEILSWLPVRSVVRFRCVCKLWNSLTGGDYFIYSHLERSKSKPPQIILRSRECLLRKGGEEVLEEAQKGFAFLESTWRPTLTLISPSIDCCYRTSRPCNGLVCLYDDYAKIRLCNPATREVQILPDATPPRTQICSLGFVARTKEYKVVRLSGNYHHYEIQVLTVGKGSWRRVGDFSSCIPPLGGGVHVDGTIYWMVRLDRDSEAGRMFCLDLTEEKLELVKLPYSVLEEDENGGELIYLTPWNGKLALVKIEMPRRASEEPVIINICTRQENNNVWNRIALPSCVCAYACWDCFGSPSFVGLEDTLPRSTSDVYFYGESRYGWSQIYGPPCCRSHREKVYGIYAFEESLVPLEKSAILEESGFRCSEIRHVSGRPRILPMF